ncbi:hypothetical protein ACLMJK_000606 [Lecanora helva]
MGVDSRKPPLPAPTESSTLQTSGGSGEEADLATDLSRRTDKTSYSIPEDGSPVIIPTKKRREQRDKAKEGALTRSSNKSQTSLLIEYFEGGKGPSVQTRPSVRVKVTPSAARKIKDTNEHVQVTASKGRKPSYTRRISLGPQSTGERQVSGSGDDKSISSYTSAAEESNLAHRHPPVEIEVMGRDDGSDMSRMSLGKEEVAREERYIQVNPSEISSMPPDSMLDEKAGTVTPRRNRSRSISKEALVNATDTLKTPSRRRSRSLSKERLAHKAMQKLTEKPREVSSGKHKRSSKTRSRSVSSEQIAEPRKSGRRRSSKSYKEEELPSGAESSLLTTSQMSPRRQSGDQYSFRSGTSKSSLNANPKLLETVENAIRRLIMPELETLKQEQKMQQSRRKFERDSVASGSSVSRDELSRKLSKHASAPDVSKPKVFLNRDENNAGTLLSGDSVKGRKESRRRKASDSPSERRYEREMSEETVIHDGEKASRKKSRDGHRLRDVAAGGMAGGILTAAALNQHNLHKDQDLKHYDSRSSVDRKERRRRRGSKSHSRSVSNAESTEDAFTKHDVPPMPMQSDIHSSEITRDSILSDRTEEPSSASEEIRMAEIRHVSRGSPREVLSPASRTPTRSPLGIQKGLGTYHSNASKGDLGVPSPHSERSHHDKEEESKTAEGNVAAAAVAGAAGAIAGRDSTARHAQFDGNDYSYSHESRGLSPIQSVSSRQESEANGDSFRHRHSTTSLSSSKRHSKKASATSLKSLGSPVSVDMRRSNRPKGINFEPGEDILAQHGLRDLRYTEGDLSDRDPAMDEWLEKEHEKNDRYHDTLEENRYRDSKESTVDFRHMTNYTDDSLDAPYLDRVAAAQELQGGAGGRNPDFVHTPNAVESAVASLLDTSTISMRSKPDGKSFTGSHEAVEAGADREVQQQGIDEEAELKKYEEDDQLSAKGSPRQSVAQSDDDEEEDEEEPVRMGASGLPMADDPLPEIGHGLHSDSDISTNPSIIQGPMGGYQNDDLDHWPDKATPPLAKGDFIQHSKDSSAHESLKAAAAGFLNTATTASRDQSPRKQSVSRDPSFKDEYEPQNRDIPVNGVNHDLGSDRDSYMSRQAVPSPPKDEGYVSGAQPRSPEISFSNAKAFNDGALDGNIDDDDVFVGPSHARHFSTNSEGLAHGMGSPLYDSATGGGMDRIQSKDIVALMDHLTVRDAQRNARDTEILVTLVRSAAEMRNSFEEMKKFISEQDDILVEHGNKQHDRTIQKIILGGPRPQPAGASRPPRSFSHDSDVEETQAKKRNVFRRALKGLSSRNQNDIGKIEEMLAHLLGEVEDLKGMQDTRASAGETRAESLDSYHNARAVGPDGYEPEGRAGTGSTGQTGYFSNPSLRGNGAMRNIDSRRESRNRVSTVLEADEELEAHEQDVLGNDEQLLTPTKENMRAGSVPLATPPQVHVPTGAQSNEHTPKTGTDKSRKHKSSGSSFLPKMSRWSKTTASSFGDNFRNSGRRERPLSEASRSGDLQQYDTNDHYDHTGDDRLRSHESFEDKDVDQQENRPPSPLIPSQVSQVSEDPKYQAHRNSQNLQHPQPRPGPTQRFQHQLETQARTYDSRSPISPTSDTFGSDPALARYVPGHSKRHSGNAGNLSPISDAGYSETSASAPPRPPKVKDDGPLIPAGPSRPPKIATKDNRPTFASPLSSEHIPTEQRYSTGSASYEATKNSPRAASGAVNQRKPTGPRPITSSGSYSPEKGEIKRTRYRGSPNPIGSSAEDVTF